CAVMEYGNDGLGQQDPVRWDDVCSWLGLERMNPQDANRNTVQGAHVDIDTTSCVVVGDPGKVIATIGVSNLLIIQDGDALLIADRREEGTVKHVVEKLKELGMEKFL